MQPMPITADPELRLPPKAEGLGALIALVEGQRKALPLQEVKVRASIAGDCARTVVEQRFANPHSQPLEVVHLFPLPDEGAVTEVELQAGDVTVRATCKEKQQAQADFAQARAQGHQAALLVAERDDVHSLRVTRIPPGEAVRVRVVIVERLERADGWMRWRFPTVIPPRYLPGEPIGHEGPGALPATDRAPDADRLQPPLRLSGGALLDLQVELAGPVRALRCAQHAVRLDLQGGGVRVAPAAEATLDRDFVLAFHGGADADIQTRAWTDGAHTLVLVEPPSLEMPALLPREAVFVIDISGSMQGRKLTAAKRALIAALHGLMPGDAFRLVAFDDRIERYPARGAAEVSDAELRRADAWVNALQARGGTEMLPAIQDSLSFSEASPEARSVLFITDGQAWNEGELVAAVAGRRGGARFFTLGIDTAVNSSLLRKLARAGGATCTLLSPSDDVEQAMAEIEARFGSPVLEGLTVEGHPEASLQAQALFAGRAASLLIEGAPGQVRVRGQSPHGSWTTQVAPSPIDFPIGALWGRARIAALDERLTLKPFEEEALRGEILRVALRFSLASRFTAFIAVDKSRVVEGQLVEIVQPAEAPEGWDMLSGYGGGPGGPPPMAAAAPQGLSRSRKSAGWSPGSAPPPPRPSAAPTPARPSPAKKGAAKGGLLGRAFDAIERGLGVGGAPSEPEPELSAVYAAEESFDEEPSFFADKEMSAMAPPPSPASAAPKRRAEPTGVPAQPRASSSGDPAGELARTQSADGSYGGEVGRTAAALVALLLAGHTRRKGNRRRAVMKAAAWLQSHASEPLAALALELLAQAEAGAAPTREPRWAPLYLQGPEGAILRDMG